MNIDEMPAGRELDALVAEKVMGHAPCNKWTLALHPEVEGWLKNCQCQACYPTGDPARYSTDIAAAWDITARMNDAAFLLERSLTANASWCARFGRHEDGRLIGTMTRGTASTPALAICRAALKLWEGKEDAHGFTSH